MDTQEPLCTQLDGAVRHGKITMIVSAASIVVWLILSDGYNPLLTIIANLYYSLTLYNDQWFCHTVNNVTSWGMSAPVEKCFDVVIYTKYFVLLSFISGTYGSLMIKALAPNPVPYLRGWVLRVINAIRRAYAWLIQRPDM